MLRPPFTILILKQSRQPLTIRVTSMMILVVVLLVTAIGGAIGFGVFYTVFGAHRKQYAVEKQTNTNFKSPDANNSTGVEPFDLKGITFAKNNRTVAGVTLSFTETHNAGNYYLWLIINPEMDISGERITIPRTPLFRGLPVDFRNGISFIPSENGDITIPFGDDASDIPLNSLRILVYAGDGTLIIDRLYHEHPQE